MYGSTHQHWAPSLYPRGKAHAVRTLCSARLLSFLPSALCRPVTCSTNSVEDKAERTGI
jgi:hypothetical protein